MAKNRSRRLRKKDAHRRIPRKWVSPLPRRFPEGTSVEQIDQDVDAFINEVIEPNKLAFDGSGYLAWEGLICTRGSGGNAPKSIRRWYANGLKTTNWKMSALANFSTFGGTNKAERGQH